MRLLQRLEALQADGRPVRVAVVGAGQMGSGVVRQIARLPGLRVVGVCDLILERGTAAATAAGVPAEVASRPEDVDGLAGSGRAAVTTQVAWLAASPHVDVVFDATGDPEAGARLVLAALGHRKTLVTMNIEADVTVGPVLAWMARSAQTVYTVAGGDEPAILCEMVDFFRGMGLEVVCAGKGKNNRLDRTATAHSVGEEAKARGMSPQMLASFVDGTKTMAEMAALANATGLQLDRSGMHGPQADLADLLQVFIPKADGGILTHRGVVEYAIGDIAPGVFVIAAAGSDSVRRDLAYLKAGNGPYHLFYRPFHLAGLEAYVSIARAALDGEVTMAPLGAPVAEVVAVAKRPLEPGEVLDGLGGTTVYGVAESARRAQEIQAVPFGVSRGARVVREVPQGAVLADADVALDETLTVVQLRRMQDVLVQRSMLTVG